MKDKQGRSFGDALRIGLIATYFVIAPLYFGTLLILYWTGVLK